MSNNKLTYKDSPLGKIPSDWEVKRFDEFAPLQRGYDLPVDQIMEGQYPVVFSNGILRYHNEFKAHGPGVVTGRSGTIGKVTYVALNYWPHNTSLWVTDFKKNHPKFVYYFLDFFDLGRFGSGSGVPTLNRNDIHNQIILVPPILEQRVIAHVLSTMDESITKINKLIAQKELRKKWLMQQLLTGKKRLKGFGGEWKEYLLGSLGDTYNGLTGKSKDDFGEGKPYIPYLNIFNNAKIDITNFDLVKINLKDYQNKAKFGDIFFTVSSETPDEVGMASVLLDEIEELYLNSFCFGFRLYDFEILWPEYSCYFLRSEIFRKELLKLSQGATRFNLSKTNLMKLNIKLPPVEEQIAIANILTILDREIELLNDKAIKLKEQKKGLMQVLLTGKKRLIIK